MAKAGELQWDELYKSKTEDKPHTPTALWVNNPATGVAPKSDASPVLKKGEVPRKPTNEEIAKAVLYNAPKQLFGGGIVSEEEAAKRQQEWENKLSKSLTMPSIGTPIDEEEWGNGQSFNSTLSREEQLQRNMFTGE